MRKIINSIKYGSAYVKRTLAIIFFFLLLGIANLAAAFFLKQVVWFFGAVICAFIIISLWQTMGIYEATQGKDDITKSKKENDGNEKTKNIEEQKDNIALGNKVDINDDEESVKKKKEKNKESKEKKKIIKNKKRKNNHKRKIEEQEDAASMEEDLILEIEDDEEIKQEENGNNRLVVIKQASEDEIEAYTRKNVKKLFHRYKVKRDHRQILIDKCEKHYINQTPAFIWVDKNEVHLLLIESEPRHMVLPLFSIKEITYLKKQAVNADTDYPAFHRKNMLTDLFRPCLPDYTQSTVVSDMNSYKNLYGFGPDIYVTNNSAKALFDLLGVEFVVNDKVTDSTKVNKYFKDAYKANIMLRDNVIDANGYADKISYILDNLAKASISYNEFKETLNLLIKNKLITQEFAMYYMGIRDKYTR